MSSLLEQPETEEDIWGEMLNITQIGAYKSKPLVQQDQKNTINKKTIRIKSIFHPSNPCESNSQPSGSK